MHLKYFRIQLSFPRSFPSRDSEKQSAFFRHMIVFVFLKHINDIISFHVFKFIPISVPVFLNMVYS